MKFWILLIALFVFFFWVKLKFPQWIGRMGEGFVNRKLFKFDPAHYKVLSDLLLPSSGNLATTQIDHVVVSNFGIFCIETKSYKGWIFGSANQEKWTQVIYRNKYRFFNPLRQNYAHMKAIEGLIKAKYPKAQIYSLVAFPYAGKLKISGTDCVGCTRDVMAKIETYNTQIFNDSERDEIYNILANANIQNKEARKLHIREVGDLTK